MYSLRVRGLWVTVSYDRKSVEGWFIGEIPQGLLLALDLDLQDVRLISPPTETVFDDKRKHPSLYRENGAKEDEKLWKINSATYSSLSKAFSRLRYDPLRTFGHKASRLRSSIVDDHLYRQRYHSNLPLDNTARSELLNFLLSNTDSAVELHEEVFETLEESGLLDSISKYGPELASMPPEFTLPAHDLQFESMGELKSYIESSRKRPWKFKRHKAAIDKAKDTRTRLLKLASERLRNLEQERVKKQSDDSTTLSRWTGPAMRVLTGTSLVTANAALGITAGLTTTSVTIGATTVPIYIGIATSIYTGLTQVAEGLEKIGRSK